MNTNNFPQYPIKDESFFHNGYLYRVFTLQHEPRYTQHYKYQIFTDEENYHTICKAVREHGFTHNTLSKGLWLTRTDNGNKLCSDLFQGWHSFNYNETLDCMELEVKIPYDD